MSNKTEQIEINAMPSTPSSHWRAEGTTDPHAGHYDGERAALAMGKLTDDELANGAFMNYDQPLNVHGIVAGTHSSPIAWMTAVKDRIRWLSRSLEKAISERDAIAEEMKALREQEPVAWVNPSYAEPAQGCTYSREDHERWPHIYSQPLYARPVPARELTDADIALCIASADKSFAQERISGKPVLGVWSKHLARAIERYLKGESE